MAEQWPDLTHESDYTFCNRLGVDAKRLNVDGLVTFSARRENGVNLAVFCREAVNAPKLGHSLAMTYDADTNTVSVERQQLA